MTGSGQKCQLAVRHEVMIVFFVALLMRLVYAAVVRKELGLFTIHEDVAQSLLEGSGFVRSGSGGIERSSVLYPPGYALFLAAIRGVLGTSTTAVYVVQSFLGAVSSVLVYRLGRFTFPDSSKIPFHSGIVCALLPFTAVHDIYLGSNGCLNVLFSLTALVLWYSLEAYPNLWRYVLTGAALGVAANFRSECLALVLPILLTGMLERRPRMLLKSALLILATGLLLLPWSVRNYQTFGVFSPAQPSGGISLVGVIAKFYPDRSRGIAIGDAAVLEADGPEYTDLMWPEPYKRDRIRLGRFYEFVANHPGKYLFVLARNVPYAWFGHQLYLFGHGGSLQQAFQRGDFQDFLEQDFWGVLDRVLGFALSFSLLLLAVYGLFLSRRSLKIWPLASFAVTYLSIVIPIGLLGRYSAPAFVFLTPFAVSGVHQILESWSRTSETQI